MLEQPIARQTVTLCTSDGFVIGRYELLATPRARPQAALRPGYGAGPAAGVLEPPAAPRSRRLGGATGDHRRARRCLLAAAAGLDSAATRARRGVLPQLSDAALVTGVAGIVKLAAKYAARLANFARTGRRGAVPGRARRIRAVRNAVEPAAGPELTPALAPATDKALSAALGNGLPYCYDRGRSAMRLFERPRRARRPEPPRPGPDQDVDDDWFHLLTVLPDAIHRAMAPFTPPEHREALLALLEACGGAGLVAPGGRLRLARADPRPEEVPRTAT